MPIHNLFSAWFTSPKMFVVGQNRSFDLFAWAGLDRDNSSSVVAAVAVAVVAAAGLVAVVVVAAAGSAVAGKPEIERLDYYRGT